MEWTAPTILILAVLAVSDGFEATAMVRVVQDTAVVFGPVFKEDTWKEVNDMIDIAIEVGFASPYAEARGKDHWETEVMDLLADRYSMVRESDPLQVQFILEHARKIAQKVTDGCRRTGRLSSAICLRAFKFSGRPLGGSNTQDGPTTAVSTTIPSNNPESTFTVTTTPAEPMPIEAEHFE